MNTHDQVPAPGSAAAAGPPARAEPPSSRIGAATHRAFVIQIRPECTLASNDFTGRVQHLASIDGGNFRSVEDLIAIMRRILALRGDASRAGRDDE
jgi:hypothetical protein